MSEQQKPNTNQANEKPNGYNAKVAGVKMTDIYGKTLLYVTIDVEGKDRCVINVGQKTFDAVIKQTQ